ncbi:hypothetical protein O3301_26505 [Janthinobacterium sp. SUN211]|uniref:hypothetical protein n=1 Tax=Janthinobacterium sp. SUN211 TaxID=3014786 RepID=UPI0027122621|nr:hypothetical protein [Janthinobacterium sp. SUN211]MDO8052027.1 hypothetical protein [Janthinobacterium sp. SUN211]
MPGDTPSYPISDRLGKDVNILLPSQLKERMYAPLVVSFFLVAGISPALATTIDEDRTRGDIHGLFEIRDAAVKFIAAENLKNGTRWQVMQPNRKILVTKCAAPLRAAWVPQSHGLSGFNVAVSCAKTVNPAIQHKWEVFVPVSR